MKRKRITITFEGLNLLVQSISVSAQRKLYSLYYNSVGDYLTKIPPLTLSLIIVQLTKRDVVKLSMINLVVIFIL